MFKEELERFLSGQMTPEEKDSFIRTFESCPEAQEEINNLSKQLFWDCETKEDFVTRLQGLKHESIDSYLDLDEISSQELDFLAEPIGNPHRIIFVGSNSVMIFFDQSSGYWEAYDLDLKLPYCADSLMQVLIDTKVQTLDYVDWLFSRPLSSMIYDDIQRVNFINSEAIGGLDKWRTAFIAGIDEHIAVAQLVQQS